MSRIFICYRRGDTAGHAGRLFDHLSSHFGEGSVFRDVDAIGAGADFVEVIQEAIDGCGAFLLLIGRRWLEGGGEMDSRRLGDPEDYVHLELATALEKEVRVIPVLIGGAAMPGPAELPESLEAIHRLNAVELRDARWDSDVGELVDALERLGLEPAAVATRHAPWRLRIVGALLAVVALGTGVFVWRALRPRPVEPAATRAEQTGPPAEVAPAEPEAEVPAETTLTAGAGEPTATDEPRERTSKKTDPPIEESPRPTPPPQSSWPAGTRSGEPRINPKDGLYYAWVPAGDFVFGCSPGDGECEDDERPPVPIDIEGGFWLSRTEVTVRAYKKAGPASILPAAPSFNAGWADETQPVVNLTRGEAERFCRSVATRLPTEVEWEYAARAGDRRGHPQRLEDVAWYAENSNGTTWPVSQKMPNDFGLFDMLGNASEWVLPAPGRDAGQGVLRGGSWLHQRRFTRYSFRLLDSPNRRDEMYGFRCLATADA